MKVQNSNYIPINHFTKNDLIKEEINARQEEIKLSKEVITNNEKQIKVHEEQKVIIQEQKDLILAQIERNEKHIDNMDRHIGNMDRLNNEVRTGLKELAPFKAYCEEQLGIKSSDAYNAAKSINGLTDSLSVANKVNEVHSRITKNIENIENNVISPNVLNHEETLREGDLMLELYNPRKALAEYNKVLVGRKNEPMPEKYSPIEEKLRQASKLYTSFQPMIDKLNVTDALKLNLYCSSIAAHTQGTFALSKAEVLHMINNQFFYPAE